MEDPFQQIPASNEKPPVFQGESVNTGIEANSSAQTFLYSIKGWVRFISVLGFIGFAVMVFYMFVMLVFLGSFVGGAGGGLGVLFLLLMLALSAVVFMLALRLSTYSSSIGRLQRSHSPADLENAMIEQMKFWRLAGILVIIILLLILLGMLS